MSQSETARESLPDEAPLKEERAPQEKPAPSVWSASLPQGNPMRLARGGAIALVGSLIAFLIMAADAQFRFGVPIAIAGLLVASFGVLDLLGTFDDPEERVAKRVTIAHIQKPLLATIGSLFGTLMLIGLASKATLPLWLAAILIPSSFLCLVASVFNLGVALGPYELDENGEPRPLLRRHGFWVIATGTLLYLPMQGSYSLSDPWETHYGEVAREILARNDWISTWWAQDGWFWSKPVLVFWTQALSMAIFGVDYRPDMMLAGAEIGKTPWPEWAMRMPVFVMTLTGLYFLYKGVAKVFGRRAALLGAIVLATMPQWFLLAHQTITDMPLVSTLSASMGLLLLGMHTDPEAKAKAYELAVGKVRFRLTALHLVLGVILMAALPQILYLASRNLELQWIAEPFGFRPHLDEFMSGSAGNCGLPGNRDCVRHTPVNAQFQPALQGLFWMAILGALLFMNRGERRLQRLYFLAAWFFAAVATMGKGPAGFGLPIVVTFAYIAATKKWKRLLSVEIVSGLLIIAAVALPWYVAMYVRHGQPFTDRLLFHDMYKRAFVHVHDTNEGDDVSFRFYIWQLGYALYMWTGLVPAALVWWARKKDDGGQGRGDVSVFLAMWFVFAFALFTAMLTKFHHYIFPAVPPAAMLTGILLDRMLGQGALAKPRSLGKYLLGVGAGAVLAMCGTIWLFPGHISGSTTENGPLQLPMAIASILGGLLAAFFAAKTFGKPAEEPAPDSNDDASRAHRYEDLMLGGVALAAAMVTALVGRDMATQGDKTDVIGQARLLHLFTYNYRRAWPEVLEFSNVFAGVAVFATVMMALLIVAKWRRHVAIMLTASALAFAAWGLDIYLVKCSPHWGQRELIEAYYKERQGAEQPLVAFQMNWKGENFYTGNQIPAFVRTGKDFKDWIAKQREEGTRTFFFVTEHRRMNSLRNELGSVTNLEKVTDEALNNKFALYRIVFD